MRSLVPSILTAAVVMTSACAASSPATVYGQEEVIVLEVAPQRAACTGEMADMCLQVRSPGEDQWRLFYDPIEGFTHEEGVGYTLEVGRREVLNPPADGLAFVYRLIRIVEERR
jgi:hypothetical protein